MLQLVQPTMELEEAYRTHPIAPSYVHTLAASTIGFPCHYHKHTLRTSRIRGIDYHKANADKLYMMWSYGSKNQTTRCTALYKDGDLLYFVDDENNEIGFWFKESPTIREKIETLINELEELCIEDSKPERVPVARISLLLSEMGGGLSEIRKKMYDWKRKPEEELRLLYDYDKFLALVNFMNANEGIAVMQGPPGTGKTSILRDAISQVVLAENPTEVVYLTSENLRAIGGEQFVNYFLRNSGRCLVCEDAEAVLQRNSDGIRNAATSNVLNLGDGILGNIAQTGMVFTLNCDTEKVDPALLRPGRCKLLWNVEPHTEEQIYKYWEYKHAQNPQAFREPEKNTGAMTLAEFNLRASIIQ